MANECGPFPDPEIPDYDADGRMIPPWLKYPNLPRRSMGWRMGIGEGYVHKFLTWWNRLPRKQRLSYRGMYVEPEEWKDFLRSRP